MSNRAKRIVTVTPRHGSISVEDVSAVAVALQGALRRVYTELAGFYPAGQTEWFDRLEEELLRTSMSAITDGLGKAETDALQFSVDVLQAALTAERYRLFDIDDEE